MKKGGCGKLQSGQQENVHALRYLLGQIMIASRIESLECLEYLKKSGESIVYFINSYFLVIILTFGSGNDRF